MTRLHRWSLSLVACVVLWVPGARASNEAACALAGTSHADGTLSPPGGEDEDFLGRSGGGLPYVAFVIDTSAWMRRFPVDLVSPEVRAAGLGCANARLDALTYDANPCVDGKGQLAGSALTGCDPTTQQPLGYAEPYRSITRYAAFDVELPDLFRADRFYVHDRGWGVKGTRVEADWVKATPHEACAAAGLPPGDAAACATCVSQRGYYLPQDPAHPPVLAGNWINFNPPRYVIARKLLKDQFAALDAPSRSRQTMLTVVDSAPGRCFSSRRGSLGMDPAADGVALLGKPTKFKPPCGQFQACVHNGSSGGGRAAFDNQVNKEHSLFTSPSGACPAGVDVPGEAPPATAAVAFSPMPDGVCSGAFVDAAGAPLGEAICAPYAEALLGAGQYLGDLGLYDHLFRATPPGTWRKPALDAADSVCPAASCGCPRPTIILLAGGAPGFDDNLPCEITGDGCAAVVPPRTCGGAGATGQSKLARVARFLAHANIKPNEHYNHPARVMTHVIAFGSDHPELREAARAGRGAFFTARSASELRAALNEAIATAGVTQYSFSSASISAVQTRTASGLIVPRFFPAEDAAFWSGKLYQFQMVNEDTCGCREPVVTGDPCDFNQDLRCGGSFFQDADGDFIAADSNGVFRKAGLVAGEFRPGVREATPIWEASERLKEKAAASGRADSRRVLTVVDSNQDSVLDHLDEVIAFDEGNAALLLPYLDLAPDGVCADLGAREGTCLDPLECAARVIRFVRGMDVLDEDCDEGTQEDRDGKLGDIFHSSPVLVDPPMRTTAPACRLGLNNQCLVSLTSTPTPLEPASAYDDYVGAHRRRDKLVLVGSNGGMLHAFRSGRWIAADNPRTAGLDECPSPADCTGYYDLGDGEELWAFIPPDLLPKLSRLLSKRHHYFVDGTAMVREIWADDNRNGKKEAGEFHTLAVVGERRGGNHFFALDVTRPEGPATLPATGFFRWIYPQPKTEAARSAGLSYSDFAPSPPPIGPVRVKTAGASTGTHRGVPFEERWVVMLNGGFDPAQLRGRTVSMVDAWRGGDGTSPLRALWTFDAGEGGFSFAATPAMVGFGEASTNPNRAVNDFFFDTATIGDVGGQLWALRFNDPDPAKWTGGRIFQSSAQGGTCARQPVFQITANTVASQGGHLRTLVGTGDRFNFADEAAGRCSANNLTGCLRRGCTLVQEVTRTVCGRTSRFRREYSGANAPGACDPSADVVALDPQPGMDCCATEVEARADYTLRCTNRDGSQVTTRWQPALSCRTAPATACGITGSRFLCQATSDTPFDICGTFDRCEEPIAPPPSGFYSVKVFDDQVPARGVFDDPAGAALYDDAVLTTARLVQVDPYTPSPARARATDDGWFVHYGFPDPPGHVFPQTPAPFHGHAKNERTASPATVAGGCAVFSTTTPGRSGGICQPRALLTTSTYALNFLTGSGCTGVDEALASRLTHRQDSEPPAPPQLAFEVMPGGGVNLQLTGVSRSAGGAAQTTPVFSDIELVKTSYRLNVSRPVHACRHPEGATVDERRAGARESCDLR